MALPSIEFVREALAYEPLTGELRWNKGVQIHLGMFDTPELAHAAYVAAARNLHGELANFG